MSNMAVITGGASGIGFSVAKKLIKNGLKVTLLDLDMELLEYAKTEINSENLFIKCVDVRNYDDFSKCISDISKEHRIDILVNNVGGNTEKIPIEDLDSKYFLNVLNDNLMTAFNGTNIVSPIMKKQGYGRIVNLASVAGRTRTHFTNAAYVSAKAGVIGLTKQAAAELAEFGVAVNAVAHGAIATDRINAAWEHKPENEKNKILDAIPTRRFGEIDEASEAVVYLCGKNSGYCIGTVIDVNGGLFI